MLFNKIHGLTNSVYFNSRSRNFSIHPCILEFHITMPILNLHLNHFLRSNVKTLPSSPTNILHSLKVHNTKLTQSKWIYRSLWVIKENNCHSRMLFMVVQEHEKARAWRILIMPHYYYYFHRRFDRLQKRLITSWLIQRKIIVVHVFMYVSWTGIWEDIPL